MQTEVGDASDMLILIYANVHKAAVFNEIRYSITLKLETNCTGRHRH